MRIQLMTPTPRSRKGNWVTAERWARILKQLGHRVTIRQEYRGEDSDLLIALHARKSFASIEGFRRQRPDRPLIVTMTGTDLYRDIQTSDDAQLAMEWADRLILLQPEGYAELDPSLRHKTRVIRQSASPSKARRVKARRTFDVCVVGHLRPVKDPFRAVQAAQLLPPSSRIRILHAGAALTSEMEAQAASAMASSSRYRWLGDIPRWKVRQLLGRSRVMVLSSLMEGGANVISEAVVAQLPVLSTRIAGSIGLLGEDHPGYFEIGDTEGLATLLSACETDPGYLERLAGRSRRLAPLFDPAREREAWQSLLAELVNSSG